MDIAAITLQGLADMPTAELCSLALHVRERQLSLVCTQLAEAKDAIALGDAKRAKMHVDRAKTAWLRHQEDEAGHVRRAQETAAKVAEHLVARGEKPSQPETGVFYGERLHVSEREQRDAYGRVRSTGKYASEA